MFTSDFSISQIKVPLIDIIDHPHGFSSFLRYANRFHSEEYLLFFQNVVDFQENYKKEVSHVAARDIFKKYLCSKSDFYVSGVPPEIITNINKKIENVNNVTKNLFQESLTYIFIVIQDLYRRFVVSSEYFRFLKYMLLEIIKYNGFHGNVSKKDLNNYVIPWNTLIDNPLAFQLLKQYLSKPTLHQPEEQIQRRLYKLEFYRRIFKFKLYFNRWTDEEKLQECESIFCTYEELLSLDMEIQDLSLPISPSLVSAELFNSSVDLIINKLLKNDIYPEFIQSKQHRNLLETLHLFVDRITNVQEERKKVPDVQLSKKSSSSKQRVEKIPLIDFTTYPVILKAFCQFCQNEFSEENYYLYLACQEYQIIQSDEARSMKAKDIFDTFLVSGAQWEICAPRSWKEEIEKKINNKEYDINLFKDIEELCFDVVLKDVYPRFMNTELYRKAYRIHQIREKKLTLPIRNTALFGKDQHRIPTSINEDDNLPSVDSSIGSYALPSESMINQSQMSKKLKDVAIP